MKGRCGAEDIATSNFQLMKRVLLVTLGRAPAVDENFKVHLTPLKDRVVVVIELSGD